MIGRTSKPSLLRTLTLSHLSVAGIGGLVLIFAVAINYQLTARVGEMTGLLEPQQQTATKLLVGLNKSLAALRGWVSLNDPNFSAQWKAAWDEEINPAFTELERLTSTLSLNENQEVLDRLRSLLNDLDESQWWVISVAQTEGNQPARVFYEQNVLPSAQIVSRVIKDLENLAVEVSIPVFTEAIISLFNSTDEMLWSINTILREGVPDWEKDFKDLEKQLLTSIRYIRKVSPKEAERHIEILEFEVTALVSLSKQAINLRLSPGWNRAKELMEVETVPLAEEIATLVELLAVNATVHVNDYGLQTKRDSIIANFVMVLFFDGCDDNSMVSGSCSLKRYS